MVILNIICRNKMIVLVESNFYLRQWSWGKVMFLHVSVILFTGVSVSVHAEIPPPQEQTPPPGADTPPEQTSPPRSSACWEIWATSGRYASCWNAMVYYNNVYYVYYNIFLLTSVSQPETPGPVIYLTEAEDNGTTGTWL